MNGIYKKGASERGFTLIEVIVSISVVLILTFIFAPQTLELTGFLQRIESESNLKSLKSAAEKWYRLNAWEIDRRNGAVFYLPDNTTAVNNTAVSGSNWEKMITTAGQSTDILQDGYNHNFRFFVSNPLSYNHEGILIPYRTIAFVTSMGDEVDNQGNTVIDSTFDPTTGELTVANSEMGIVVSGLGIQLEKFEASKKRLSHLIDSYTQYYWARFRAGPNEPAINYFANRGSDIKWDVNGTVEATCGKPSDSHKGHRLLGTSINNVNFKQALSLSETDIIDGYARPYRILNCGNTNGMRINGVSRNLQVRDPNTVGIPPYTASLGFTLPNGESYIMSASSKF